MFIFRNVIQLKEFYLNSKKVLLIFIYKIQGYTEVNGHS